MSKQSTKSSKCVCIQVANYDKEWLTILVNISAARKIASPMVL